MNPWIDSPSTPRRPISTPLSSIPAAKRAYVDDAISLAAFEKVVAKALRSHPDEDLPYVPRPVAPPSQKWPIIRLCVVVALAVAVAVVVFAVLVSIGASAR
jgi:hypothetical protein